MLISGTLKIDDMQKDIKEAGLEKNARRKNVNMVLNFVLGDTRAWRSWGKGVAGRLCWKNALQYFIIGVKLVWEKLID